MKLLDVNILLYAVDENAPQHSKIHVWLEQTLNGAETLGLDWVVVLGFLRISTNPRVFPRPLTVDQALTQIDTLLAHPHVCIMNPTDDHWLVFKQLLVESGTAGNLTSDAHLAAVAISHNATLVSCDADFGRFRNLRWENPLTT